jgi:hypothetical protein
VSGGGLAHLGHTPSTSGLSPSTGDSRALSSANVRMRAADVVPWGSAGHDSDTCQPGRHGSVTPSASWDVGSAPSWAIRSCGQADCTRRTMGCGIVPYEARAASIFTGPQPMLRGTVMFRKAISEWAGEQPTADRSTHEMLSDGTQIIGVWDQSKVSRYEVARQGTSGRSLGLLQVLGVQNPLAFPTGHPQDEGRGVDAGVPPLADRVACLGLHAGHRSKLPSALQVSSVWTTAPCPSLL